MRLRVEYLVGPQLKYLGHFDLMHLLQRAMRRAEIEYALSQGFNPHIKLSLGTVLPVGLWGSKEYFDLELRADITPETFAERLNRVLPQAVRIRRSIVLPVGAPSLMKVINASSYTFFSLPGIVSWDRIAQHLWSADKLTVFSKGKQKGKNKDLRPGIFRFALAGDDDFDMIRIWVSSGSNFNIRFDELQQALFGCGMPRDKLVDLCRCGNYLMEGENFYSPLEKVL